ncbi:MAG: hypothetical protein JWO22_2993 [Frankiales bacterium]|nr:hypothetical protein [Frankiales bacterium]
MTHVALDVLQTGPVAQEESSAPGRLAGVSRRAAAIRAIPSIGTYLGVLVATVGLILLVIAWGKTAGIAGNVALQIPYVISAGFTGVALVVVGLTIVNVDAKRSDARERTRQLTELRGLLAELRTTVEEDQ